MTKKSKAKKHQLASASAPDAGSNNQIKNILSESQRAEIGAIGLASQALITALESFFPFTIANEILLALIKRTANSTKDKITWMKLGLKGLPIPSAVRDGIQQSLDAANQFLHLRNSVIHCDLVNAETGSYQGNTKVSLKKEDLEFIYNNLCCTYDEITGATDFLSKTAKLSTSGLSDQDRERLSKEVQASENQLQTLLAQRGSVPLPPGLPSEDQLVEAEALKQATEATKAIENPWRHSWFHFAEALPPPHLRQAFQPWFVEVLAEEEKAPASSGQPKGSKGGS